MDDKCKYGIKEESIHLEVNEFKNLPDLNQYEIAYVGKHKAISPLVNSKDLLEGDMEKHLLIECRLFNESEEIFIYVSNNQIIQRVIKNGDKSMNYIDKTIQMRNLDKNYQANKELTLRHYLGENGYKFQRYIKIK